VAICLYFVVVIDRDSFTEVLELEKLDDKLISLYQNLTDFKYGKLLVFKGELQDAQFQPKYTDLSFLTVKGILSKYEFLKEDNKGIDYEILEDYINKIYFGKEDLKVEN
jgi:hypothetical protein